MVAFALMILDHQYTVLTNTRAVLGSMVAPIRYMVDGPARVIRWTESRISFENNLVVENAQLRANELVLRSELQSMVAIKKENDQLRTLLSSSGHVSGKVLVAQLLAVDLAPFTRQVIINKGKHDGVYVGQPIIDAYGVIGQVIEVSFGTSRVLLVSDSRSAVPVQNVRTGNRAIAAGQGVTDQLQLMFVPDTADFQVGDHLETSGLGQLYPASYPVGVIVSVNHKVGDRFSQITVDPSAHLDRSQYVLLVWPVGKSG